VIGFLCPPPADNHPVLVCIQHTDLCPEEPHYLQHAVPWSLPGLLLHSVFTYSLGGNAQHLKSRHPFVPTAQLMSSSGHGRAASDNTFENKTRFSKGVSRPEQT